MTVQTDIDQSFPEKENSRTCELEVNQKTFDLIQTQINSFQFGVI